MKRLAVTGFALALLLVPVTQVAAAGTSSPCRQSAPFAYHWPIKPFEAQHPVRSAFGEPRIVSDDQPFGVTGPSQSGGHSFHNGIDIVAPPETPVYPVVSGRVVRATQGQIVVHTDDGRSFQYRHLTRAPAVQPGRCVIPRRTVLGWTRTGYEHLHLAEIDNYVVHNPLDRGHLEPYRDWTRPNAADLYLANGSLPTLLDGRAVGPGDQLAVDVADPPAASASGQWFGLPQVPSLVEWRLFRGTAATMPWRAAVDFRHTEPPPRAFWDVYGAGTYQNCPRFEQHAYPGTPGRYLVRLHLHPDRLQPGPYRLTVRVGDVRGNQSTASWRLVVGD